MNQINEIIKEHSQATASLAEIKEKLKIIKLIESVDFIDDKAKYQLTNLIYQN